MMRIERKDRPISMERYEEAQKILLPLKTEIEALRDKIVFRITFNAGEIDTLNATLEKLLAEAAPRSALIERFERAQKLN